MPLDAGRGDLPHNRARRAGHSIRERRRARIFLSRVARRARLQARRTAALTDRRSPDSSPRTSLRA
jgi:hypothetical protein